MDTQLCIAVVLIDGIGDCAIDSLSHQTPLQFASPSLQYMNLIAQHGVNGLMDPVGVGLACGTDTAHLSLFGYDPRLYYRGRGAFESMGAGLEMDVGDIAFKSNFATLDPETRIVLRRRADRKFHEWGTALCRDLTGLPIPAFPDVHVDIRYATEHRCGVRLRGKGLSDEITGTDPLVDGRPLRICQPTRNTVNAQRTSDIVNNLSAAIEKALIQHPISFARMKMNLPYTNCILFRGCGARLQVESFESRHKLKPFLIAPTAIVGGLGSTLSIERIKAPHATGDYSTDFASKAETFVQNLTRKDYDFGFLHVKAVDDAGHDKDIKKKVFFLKKCDSMLGDILRKLAFAQRQNRSREFLLVLTGDHSTPVMHGDHSPEPVPLAVCLVRHLLETVFQQQQRTSELSKDNITHTSSPCHPHNITLATLDSFAESDHCTAFHEIEASRGILGRFPGRELMPLLKRLRDQFKTDVRATAREKERLISHL
eukprot:TRINITY_DN11918_c0_g1_i1.p1 TRINITY_DN11918_c0_g1~~TRINITY_DN11918_c0_g1_i1.p1  ORF type:complete len:484 (-),score=52.83 TRINITY_DN11918_c0_g1_i1:428-1879(-)